MDAIQVREDRSLVWAASARPPLPPGHVRIRVRATAVNRADLLQREGRYAPPAGASPILGLEAAGEVIEAAPGATLWTPGAPVCALLAGGGYAEEVVVPEGHVLPIPRGMAFEHAAALPEVLTTAWLNLWLEAGLESGEQVLLHAGASGVGTAAVQLCRAFGHPCWVTAGTREKVDRCVALGAAGGHVGHGGFLPAVERWTGGVGVDVILDPVGGGYLEEDLRSLKAGGRLLIIGLMGGREDRLDLGRLLVKRLRVIGSVLRSRSDAEKTRILRSLRENVWPLVEDGRVRPVVDRVLPITAAEDAHALLARNETIGKVVLTVP